MATKASIHMMHYMTTYHFQYITLNSDEVFILLKSKIAMTLNWFTVCY